VTAEVGAAPVGDAALTDVIGSGTDVAGASFEGAGASFGGAASVGVGAGTAEVIVHGQSLMVIVVAAVTV
jgi:hypothetical protein